MQPEPALTGRVSLRGSERIAVDGAAEAGPIDPEEQAEVTVHLRSRTADDQFQKLVEDMSAKPVARREYMSREELSQLRGASPSDIAHVEQFARTYNLSVSASDVSSRTMTLRGTLRDLQEGFGVQLKKYSAGGKTFRARSGYIYLPADVAPAITGVFGLDTRPVARPK
jgi:kumamolisin